MLRLALLRAVDRLGGSRGIGIVHGGSGCGLCVTHGVVMVAVVQICENTLVILVMVLIEVFVIVNFAGVVAIVWVTVVEGIVVVNGTSVVSPSTVTVVKIVVEGVMVMLKIAVGVSVTVTCGPALR